MEKEQDKQKIIIEKKKWVMPNVEIISNDDIESGVVGAYEASHPQFHPQSILAVS